MASLRITMKRLQNAIIMQGYILKINTFQFYSEQKGRMLTGYILLHPEYKRCKDGEMKLCDKQLLKSYNIPEIVVYMSNLYKELKERDKKTN